MGGGGGGAPAAPVGPTPQQAVIQAAQIQARAAREAAETQERIAREGLDFLQTQFDESRAIIEPFAAAGRRGTTALEGLLGLRGPEAQQEQLSFVTEGPQFQTALELGREQLERSAAARGTLESGAFAQDLSRLTTQTLLGGVGQQQAALGQLAGLGAAAASGQAGGLQQLGQAGSDIFQGIGQVQAESTLAAANAQAQGLIAKAQLDAAQRATMAGGGGGGLTGAPIAGAVAGGMAAGPLGLIGGTAIGGLAELFF